MATIIKNAAPKAVLNGIRDLLPRRVPVVREDLPQHLPFFYLLAERGNLFPQVVSGKAMVDMYGAESFNERSKFFSHSTLGIATANGNGNAVMLKRVVPNDAAISSLVLTVEVVPDDIPDYDRDPISNRALVDPVTGVKQVLATVTPGYRLAWAIKPLTDITNLRGETVGPGVLTGTGASTIYPILAFRAGYGDYGNNVGLRLSFPGPDSAFPGDMDLVQSELAMLYRAQFVERPTALSLPNITQTVYGQRSIDLTFKKDVVNPKTDEDLDIGRLISEYQAIDPSTGLVPVYGPFNDMFFYEDNVNAILDLLFAAEETANPGNITARDQVNILDTLDQYGIEQYATIMDSTSISMDSNTTHYAVGGSDGTVDEATLGALVENECLNNWYEPDWPLVDSARYPMSILYDTGYPNDTKKAIISTIGNREDISVTVCTQDVLNAVNTGVADTSIMMLLRTHARLYPESTLWGTPVTRVVAVGQAGEQLHSRYRNPVPLVMALIDKRSKYMGAGTGAYKEQFAYDVAPNNRIDTIIGVSTPWKNDLSRSRDWEIGLNWAQYADRRQLFFPAIQTVYDNDTSVLNSDINMLIAVDVIKQTEETWRRMTGNSKLTRPQFVDKCNATLLALVSGRYDNRVVIEANTYFTNVDDARGYSWTLDVTIYMNNMLTVGQMNVISKRRSDLTA